MLWRSDCIVLPGEGYGYNWATYKCTSCYDQVLIRSHRGNKSTSVVKDIYPEMQFVAEELPPRARKYLEQAVRSIHAPDGAAILAGSAVDAMLTVRFELALRPSRLSKCLEPRPLERPRVTVHGVGQAGRHGIEQRPDGAAHRQHTSDDEDGDEGHDQGVLDGGGGERRGADVRGTVDDDVIGLKR